MVLSDKFCVEVFERISYLYISSKIRDKTYYRHLKSDVYHIVTGKKDFEFIYADCLFCL